MIIFPFPALIFRCVVSGYYSKIIGQNLFCQHNWIYPNWLDYSGGRRVGDASKHQGRYHLCVEKISLAFSSLADSCWKLAKQRRPAAATSQWCNILSNMTTNQRKFNFQHKIKTHKTTDLSFYLISSGVLPVFDVREPCWRISEIFVKVRRIKRVRGRY